MVEPTTGIQSRIVVTSPGPSLPDLLQILGAAGTVIGAFLGFIPTAADAQDMVRNVLTAATLGGVLGLLFAFALAGALALNGGVG